MSETTESPDVLVIQVSDKVKLEVEDIMGGKLENIAPNGVPGILTAFLIILKTLGLCHRWHCEDLEQGPDHEFPVKIKCKSGWKLIFFKCK